MVLIGSSVPTAKDAGQFIGIIMILYIRPTLRRIAIYIQPRVYPGAGTHAYTIYSANTHAAVQRRGQPYLPGNNPWT